MTRAGAIAAAALLLLAGVLAGCDAGDASPSPTGAGTPPTATPGTEPSPTAATGLPGQSESEWGPIWDALPPTLPVPPGAQPTEPQTGAVSAAYLVPVVDGGAQAIAQLYAAAFEDRGLSASVDGPLEDGSFTAWASNGYGCDTLVTVLPRGEEHLVTVLYGTGCPFA